VVSPSGRGSNRDGRVSPRGRVSCRSAGCQHQLAAVARPRRPLAIDGDELDAMAVVPRTTGGAEVAWPHRRVETVGLEAGARNGDVEPQLVEYRRSGARADVAAERVVDVLVNRLQRVPVRITLNQF